MLSKMFFEDIQSLFAFDLFDFCTFFKFFYNIIIFNKSITNLLINSSIGSTISNVSPMKFHSMSLVFNHIILKKFLKN